MVTYFVSVTRLRVRARRYLPAFVFLSLRSARQAKTAQGNVAVVLLAEKNRTYWTCTIWTDEAAMRAFARAKPHRHAMKKLAGWCDEAALVNWTQDTAVTPSWTDAAQRLQHEGRTSPVNHPTPAQTNFQITPPRYGRSGQLRIK